MSKGITRHIPDLTSNDLCRRPTVIGSSRTIISSYALLLAIATACTEVDRTTESSSTRQEPATSVAGSPASDFNGPFFEDQTGKVGLGDFVHFNGMTGERLYSEMMGSGVALFDADNDGDLDIYAVQGGMVDPSKSPGSTVFPAPEPPWIDRFYRNDLIPGGTLRFEDATQESGILADGYGMGVAVGDIDNDGFSDLFVMNDGPDQLWRNLGDGTFENHTAAAGVASNGWSVSAAFVDIDRDGSLDLFVVRYVDFSVNRAKPCKSLTGRVDYCGPLSHPPITDQLYRNRGDGTFDEVTQELGMVAPAAAGLGVAVLDFNRDGFLDLAVANDGMPNHLWRNDLSADGGRFTEVAVPAGISVNQEGQAEAGMGIMAGDPDGDGDEDLLLTHLALETHTFYRNDGRGGFIDRSQPIGVGAPSWNLTGFGVAFLDLDLDGRLDLAGVAGGVKIIAEQLDTGELHPLKMHKQLYRNVGDRFEVLSVQVAGDAFEHAEVGRGLAVGDVDNDGDPDLLVSNNSGPLELLINRFLSHHRTADVFPWVGARMLDRHGRDALGALVISPRRIRVGTDGSYASSRDPRLVFEPRQQSQGPAEAISEIVVRWVDGREESFIDLESGKYVTLRQGQGRLVERAEGAP